MQLWNQLKSSLRSSLPMGEILETKSSSSQRTSLLQQSWEVALLSLQFGVAADVLLVDEDVGHGALAGEFLQGALDVGAVLYRFRSQYMVL